MYLKFTMYDRFFLKITIIYSFKTNIDVYVLCVSQVLSTKGKNKRTYVLMEHKIH
jgi:hypothetical protein